MTATSLQILPSTKPRQGPLVVNSFNQKCERHPPFYSKPEQKGVQQRKTQEKHRFRKREKIDYGGNSGDPLHFQRHQPLGCTIVIRLFTHSRLGHEARPVSDTKVRKIRGVIESTLRQLCECGIEESQIQGARVEYQSGPIKGAHLLKAMRSQVSASRTNNGSKSNCPRG